MPNSIITSSLEPNTSWDDLAGPEFPVSSNAWSLVVLEAWRRNLKVEIAENRHFTVSSSETSLKFRMNRLATPEAADGARICNNKHETKIRFQRSNLPTPAGRLFNAPIDKGLVLEEANSIGFPICLKAANWSKGKGVFPNLSTEIEVEKFLDILVDDLQCESVIIEENFEGEDFRFFVVGDKVSGVIQRLPANVTGDGTSTIKQLVELKNVLRAMNPYLRGAPIMVDDEIDYMLTRQGKSLDSVLATNEILFLREKSNASTGGDTIDVSDRVSWASKELAVRAIKAIPGVSHGGVDILIRDPFTENESATLIEINQSAEMGLHLYPAYGGSTYPPKDIVEHYFPNSPLKEGAQYWYFNLNSIFALLRDRVAESVVVKKLSDVSNLVWRAITFTGHVQGVGFRRWLVREARGLSISGDVRNCETGEVLLRVCGQRGSVEALVSMVEAGESPASVQTTLTKQISEFRVSPGLRVLRGRS